MLARDTWLGPLDKVWSRVDTTEFGDRLRLGTYRDDPEVHFGLEGKEGEPVEWTGVPERLVSRLTSLGEAYELRQVTMIDIYGDTIFKSKQCESLCAELHFLNQIADDPALATVVETLTALIKAALASSRRLVVSGN